MPRGFAIDDGGGKELDEFALGDIVASPDADGVKLAVLYDPAEKLLAVSGKLCRRLSVSRLRERTADKRGGGEVPLALDELSETVGDSALSDKDDGLSAALDAFLRTLPETERRVFLCRYFYADSVKDVAARFGFGESKVKMMLLRTREKLRAYLKKEGYFV